MKCDLCGKRTAVVFVQESSLSSRAELHLCAECAKERGVEGAGDGVRLSIADLFSSISGDRPPNAEVRSAERCPICSCSLNELKQRGLASCPACYRTFSFELFRSVYPDARSRHHAGRVPRRFSLARKSDDGALLQRARDALKEALDREDYEAAARCRDDIRSLERGGSGRD